MLKYLSPIDPHVHLRGTEYTDDYLALGLRDARAVGMAAVIEQPNPQPWLTSEETVMARVAQAAAAGYGAGGNPRHGAHIGLTNDPDQVIAALKLIQRGAYGVGTQNYLAPKRRKYHNTAVEFLKHLSVIGHLPFRSMFRQFHR